ncbi:sugar phosphate isomerase/epimerase [bacterium]|nr:sugar phosphate isomerase/epimerase [bacterium]
MNEIYLHQNSYKNYPVETLFKKASEFGFDGVEIGISYEKAEEEILLFKELKEKYKLKNVILHRPVRTVKEEEFENADKEIEMFAEIIHFAKKHLNIELINTMAASTLLSKDAKYIEYDKNGSAIAKEFHFERAAQTFKKISRIAEREKIYLAVEIHGCLIHDTPESTLKLLKMINSEYVKINFDYGNLYLRKQEYKVEDVLNLLFPYIIHSHTKNLRKIVDMPENGDFSFFFTSIKEGEIDYRFIVLKLKERNYRGSFTFEYPGSYGDPDLKVKNDIIYFRELLEG